MLKNIPISLFQLSILNMLKYCMGEYFFNLSVQSVRLVTFVNSVAPNAPLFYTLQLLTNFDISILQIYIFVFKVRHRDLTFSFI